jgi:hypothetical protein
VFPDDEIRTVLEETLPLVESALLSHYRLPRDDASHLERELLEWFDRLRRRPGTPRSADLLKAQLISMTCKVGHVYWAGKLGPKDPQDESLKRTLALGPEIIAIEIEQGIHRERTDER